MPRVTKPKLGRPKKRIGPVHKPSPQEALELWALLGKMDGSRLTTVKRKLERTMRTGSRYFCALKRAVPLHDLHDAQREISELEKDVSDEVWSTAPKRKWIRRNGATAHEA